MSYRHPSFRGRIGVARRDITPPIGIRHRNWGAQTHEVAEGIHRPLTTTVMTLEASPDHAPVVIVALDLGWWRTSRDEWALRGQVLAALDLPESNLLICLSHTHAGPTTHLGDDHLPGGDLVGPYVESVAQKVTLAIEEALASAEESVLDFAKGESELACLRDVKEPEQERYLVGCDPYDVVDRTLSVGRVTTLAGRLRATLLHYGCHPTSLGPENRLISPDYVGAAREVLEDETGVSCLFLQGWSGDLAPRDQFSGDTAVADRNGRRLGLAALSVFLGMLPAGHAAVHGQTVESGAPLQILGLEAFEVPTRLVAEAVTSEIRLKPRPSRRELDTALMIATEPFEIERLHRQRLVLDSIPDDFRLPLWLVRAGDLVLAGVPGEMTSRYAFTLQELDEPEFGLPVNVVNGWYGYLPERAMYDRDQYSVWQTPFAPPSAEMVFERIMSHLNDDPEPDR